MNSQLEESLETILANYQGSFGAKTFLEETTQTDLLMDVFGLTQEIKSGNKQYWGRELGKCWERLIIATFRALVPDWTPGINDKGEEICDLTGKGDAIDAKYRVGSGDSGTLGKFRRNAVKLLEMDLRPVMLILRGDNLPAAMSACASGGWVVIVGDDSFTYLRERTGFDLEQWLRDRREKFAV